MRPELILWDWNGTLLDDVELCVDALNRLLQSYGYPQRYDRNQYRAIFGFPIEEYYIRAGTARGMRPRLCGAPGAGRARGGAVRWAPTAGKAARDRRAGG